MFCPLKEIPLLCSISCSFLVFLNWRLKVTKNLQLIFFKLMKNFRGSALAAGVGTPESVPHELLKSSLHFYSGYKHRDCLVLQYDIIVQFPNIRHNCSYYKRKNHRNASLRCAQWKVFCAIGSSRISKRERNCLYNNDLSVLGSEIFRAYFA